MAKVRWKWNLAGFAELRNSPALVSAMEGAMRAGAAGTPFEVEVWAHRGRQAGPRTVVQAWARTPEAMRLVGDNPGAMHNVLAATGIPFERRLAYRTKGGRVRSASQAQISNWTRGRR